MIDNKVNESPGRARLIEAVVVDGGAYTAGDKLPALIIQQHYGSESKLPLSVCWYYYYNYNYNYNYYDYPYSIIKY